MRQSLNFQSVHWSFIRAMGLVNFPVMAIHRCCPLAGELAKSKESMKVGARNGEVAEKNITIFCGGKNELANGRLYVGSVH